MSVRMTQELVARPLDSITAHWGLVVMSLLAGWCGFPFLAVLSYMDGSVELELALTRLSFTKCEDAREGQGN